MPVSTTPVEIETTLWELARAIREVSDSDDEAFAVLETMLAEDRVHVGAAPGPALT